MSVAPIEAMAVVPTQETTSIVPIDGARWTNFVESCEQAVPFHHPAWAMFVAECYGYEAFALTTMDAEGRITSGLPIIEARSARRRRRWVSLPFTDACEPLAGSPAALAVLADRLAATGGEADVESIEVRAPLPAQTAYVHSSAVTHTLALSPDHEAVMRAFGRAQVRRDIRKAEREGVTVRCAEASTDLTDVYYDLQARTRRRLGVPVQPRRFFELLWERLIEPGLGFVLIAYVGDVPVAGAVFLAWNGTVSYKYSASDPAFWRLCPNNLVIWTAISWGCENGYTSFDFGRSETENAGLRAFKSGWGATEEPLYYSTIADRPPRPSKHRLERAAAAVIRRSPLWVCRAAGTVLYKHAA
jgi:CelD/BcsL family acetyltransferase involved in cellulose biosynthesis